MKTVVLGKHKVTLYDSIDELPIKRFHVYNRMLLVDAGIGSDIADFDNHIERAIRYHNNGDKENFAKEFENLRQNVYLILNQQNTEHLSFACLVTQVDDTACNDLSTDGLQKVLEMLGDVSKGSMTEVISSVKKKIDDELMLYFPALFNDVRTREYYDMVKRLTMNMLEQVTDGETKERRDKAEAIREQLVLFSKPKAFAGHNGLEVQHDKEFETMCLVITKETGREAKNMTVLEYYNAYEYIKNQQKRQNKAR